MAEEGFKRKLAAILSADVKGYSRLMDDDEEATVRTLTSYRSAITDLVQQYRGRVVDSPGDNILAEFASVVDSVNCAVEIQRELAERNEELPDNRKMQFRIGVNLGDVIDEDGRIYGDGVNIAARVESLAEAGGICISGRAHTQVENKLGLEYEDLGKHEVKNISKPIQVYRVLSYPGAAAHRVVQAKESLGRKWRKIAIAAAVVIAVIGGLAYWQFYVRRPTVEPASKEKMAFPLPEKPSIAVLPFDNMSGDSQQDYLADGISENIISALSSIPEIFVIARNSSFTYKGKPVKVQQVSEEMGVRYILEGSVIKSGDKIRVTAQLIDALTGGHIWSERYDRDFKELFALLDEITQVITVELQVTLSHGEQARMWYKSTSHLEAWGYAVKGLDIFYSYSKEGMVKSRELFEKALRIDPEYAHAMTMLGWTHYIDAKLGYVNNSKASLKLSVELANKAVILNEKDPLVHSLLQHIYILQRNYDKAIEEGRKAIALGPSDAEAHILFGEALYQSGFSEEAVQICEKAMRLHPRAPLYYYGHMMQSYYDAGRYNEALAVAKRLIEQSQKAKWNMGISWGMQGSALALMELGQENEAREYVTQLVSASPQRINIERFRKYSIWAFYKDTAHSQRILDTFRKAGMPEHEPLPLPDKPSIAVLAFDNLSGDPEQEYFSDGLSEEIISALSKTDQLFVIARNSSFTYKGKSVNVKQISWELGVRYVLEGSVRKSEDRVRITAQLIDAATGHHLWSDRYDRDLKEIFAIQDEITMKIITALQVELTEGEQIRIWAKRYKRLDVLLKAMELLSLWRKGTEESTMRAGQVAQEVVDMAPDLPVGYRQLGWYHWFLAGLGRSPRENLKKAYGYALKAISLDEYDGLSHGLLGSVYLRMRQHEKAIAAGKRAVELDPNGAEVSMYLGHTLSFAGRPDEAIEYLNKAIRLNPFPPYFYPYNMGRSYLLKGHYEKAIKELKKAIQLAPMSPPIHIYLAVTYSLLGQEEEARASAEKALKLAPFISVSLVSKTLPYKNQADLELILDGMRKAGFPEGA